MVRHLLAAGANPAHGKPARPDRCGPGRAQPQVRSRSNTEFAVVRAQADVNASQFTRQADVLKLGCMPGTRPVVTHFVAANRKLLHGGCKHHPGIRLRSCLPLMTRTSVGASIFAAARSAMGWGRYSAARSKGDFPKRSSARRHDRAIGEAAKPKRTFSDTSRPRFRRSSLPADGRVPTDRPGRSTGQGVCGRMQSRSHWQDRRGRRGWSGAGRSGE